MELSDEICSRNLEHCVAIKVLEASYLLSLTVSRSKNKINSVRSASGYTLLMSPCVGTQLSVELSRERV